MKKLIQNPAAIEAILESMQDGVMLVDPSGRIQLVNSAMERITGFTREELEGAPCTILGCDACQVLRSEVEDTWCMLFHLNRVKDKKCMFTQKEGRLVSAVKNAKIIQDENGDVIGALEVIQDLSDLEKLDFTIQDLTHRVDHPCGFYGMVGSSPVLQEVFRLIEKAGQTDTSILITGESGTGKELVVDALHQISHRKDGPLVKINCSALNETLMESELFGHEKGAFTGAVQHRRGHFETASSGDLFLDEIGDMPLAAQAKLLRAVESGEVTRVGGSQPQKVDVRIIAATNRDLARMVREGTFREDLYFRINVFPIPLPPLRERREDIPILAAYILSELSCKNRQAAKRVSPEVLDFFQRHDWPGNIRELHSVMEYAACLSDTEWVGVQHLPETYQQSVKNKRFATGKEAEETDEKKALLEALRMTDGNQSRAAKLLGVHRMTVFNRMRKYGISPRRILESGDDDPDA